MNILPLVVDDWFKNIRLFFPEAPGVVVDVFWAFVNDKNFFIEKGTLADPTKIWPGVDGFQDQFAKLWGK